ncbi:MAG: hypothetical protein EOP60_04730 [Sphingomonadales bacterium]|nr:MAG: hypothetical protein EOP60_04730 [Sphingomonadales bacterium]
MRVGPWIAATAIALLGQPAVAQTRVQAEAEVKVANGRHFVALMRYAGLDDAEYVRRMPEGESRYTIDRDGVWLTSATGKEQLDPDLGLWVLSHNFHAQILDFARLNGGVTRHALRQVGCDCEEVRGKRAAPALGILHLSLIIEREGGKARRILIHRKGAAPVVSIFSDWRMSGGNSLPFTMDVDDGKDRYAFRFTSVTVE